MNWYLHACPVCGGALHDDIVDKGWITCFMCVRSFPMKGGKIVSTTTTHLPTKADRKEVAAQGRTEAGRFRRKE